MKSKLRLIAALCAALFVASTVRAEPPTTIRKCQGCHGKQLAGKKKNPSIVGLSYEKLYAALTTNVPKKMKRVSTKLTEVQKAQLSEYIFNFSKSQ